MIKCKWFILCALFLCRMSKKIKQTHFQDSWLSSEFKSWVCKASLNTDARYKLCKVNISLSNMGIMALKSHVKNKTHEKLVQEQNQIKNFLSWKIKPTPKHQWKKVKISHHITAKICFKLNFLVHILKAQFHSLFKMEVRWVLKHAVSGYSDNSVTDSVNVFIQCNVSRQRNC